jgi:hypothetical protein
MQNSAPEIIAATRCSPAANFPVAQKQQSFGKSSAIENGEPNEHARGASSRKGHSAHAAQELDSTEQTSPISFRLNVDCTMLRSCAGVSNVKYAIDSYLSRQPLTQWAFRH